MNTIKDMMEGLIRQSCEILATVRKINETDYTIELRNFEYLTDRLVMLSEKLACTVRDFSGNTYVASRYKVLDDAAQTQGIEVRRDENTIIIDLPFLLPRKKGKQSDFIGDPLMHRLEEFSKTGDLKIRDKAVICIIHIYDGADKNARCYDYDNLETKKILDIITLFTLTDDAPQYCDVYHTVQISNCNKTKILIMPVDDFRDEKMSLIF